MLSFPIDPEVPFSWSEEDISDLYAHTTVLLAAEGERLGHAHTCALCVLAPEHSGSGKHLPRPGSTSRGVLALGSILCLASPLRGPCGSLWEVGLPAGSVWIPPGGGLSWSGFSLPAVFYDDDLTDALFKTLSRLAHRFRNACTAILSVEKR